MPRGPRCLKVTLIQRDRERTTSLKRRRGVLDAGRGQGVAQDIKEPPVTWTVPETVDPCGGPGEPNGVDNSWEQRT